MATTKLKPVRAFFVCHADGTPFDKLPHPLTKKEAKLDVKDLTRDGLSGLIVKEFTMQLVPVRRPRKK